MQPENAEPETLFWVVELDGTTTLRPFRTIKDDGFGPGHWDRDERHGNAFFVRDEERKGKN